MEPPVLKGRKVGLHRSSLIHECMLLSLSSPGLLHNPFKLVVSF